MANTDVVLVFNAEGGVYIPAITAVPVVKGDTISFSTSDGSAVQLFFSPDAHSVLTPAPNSPHSIGAGEKVRFEFKSSAAGAYSVFVEPVGTAPNSAFPTFIGKELQLQTDFPVIVPVMQNNPMIKG